MNAEAMPLWLADAIADTIVEHWSHQAKYPVARDKDRWACMTCGAETTVPRGTSKVRVQADHVAEVLARGD